MTKRRRSDEEKDKPVRGEAAVVAKSEDDKPLEISRPLLKIELEAHDLKEEVRHLKDKISRLKQEALEATCTAKQSTTVAAAASMDLIDCQMVVKQLRQENANLVGEVEKIAKLEERCNLLAYERDGLRSRLRSMNEGRGKMEEEKKKPSESTKMLEEKVEWYAKSLFSEQQKVKEQREKSKVVEAELSNRISALTTQLTRSEAEKQSALELLKTTKADSEKLTEKLSVELKSSLEAREKLNKDIDESENEKNELESRYETYRLRAKEYIQKMEKEKEELNESLTANKLRADMLSQKLTTTQQKLDDTEKEIQEMKEKRQLDMLQQQSAPMPSSFGNPHSQFGPPTVSTPPMDNSFRLSTPTMDHSFRRPLIPFPSHQNQNLPFQSNQNSMGGPAPSYMPVVMNALRGPHNPQPNYYNYHPPM